MVLQLFIGYTDTSNNKVLDASKILRRYLASRRFPVHVLAGMPAAPLRARAAAAFAAFQADLRALVRTIDERNARRRHPLQTFNPRFVLSAVSI